MYPESAPDDWEEVIDSWGVTCYVSPLHDMDVNKHGELKKPHYHGVLTFEGNKSYGQIMSLVAALGCNTALVCNSIHNALRYLCHMDNPDKAQYDISDVRTFGHADLSALYLKTEAETNSSVLEILNIARQYRLWEFSDLCEIIMDNYPDDLFPVLRNNHAFIRAFCQGMLYKVKS